jgi:hypothetical protein
MFVHIPTCWSQVRSTSADSCRSGGRTTPVLTCNRRGHEQRERRVVTGMPRANRRAPAWELEGWVTSYAAVAAGEWDVVSDAVETITGRPTSANPALWEKLAADPRSDEHGRECQPASG